MYLLYIVYLQQYCDRRSTYPTTPLRILFRRRDTGRVGGGNNMNIVKGLTCTGIVFV